MKFFYFGATCACASMFAGLVSGSVAVGFFSGLTAWWLLISIDTIFNPHLPPPPKLPTIPGDCESEL